MTPNDKPKSVQLKQAISSTFPEPGVKLSEDQVDALIKQLNEIAQANVELIEEVEDAKRESERVRKASARLQIVVALAFTIGALVAIGIYYTNHMTENIVREESRYVQREVAAMTKSHKTLNDNVALTLGVVRALSEAQAAKVKADVRMDPKSENEAARKATEVQRKALEAETKIEQDPAKKAKAAKQLKAIDEDEFEDGGYK